MKKANLFAEILKKTFSDQNDQKFDEKHKEKIEQKIKNHDFVGVAKAIKRDNSR